MVARNNTNGFSLIELCIVLVIIGTLIGSVLPALNASISKSYSRETSEKLKLAREAIRNYYNLNMHYPCPADPGILFSAKDYAKSSEICGNEGSTVSANKTQIIKTLGKDEQTVYIGLLPFRSLGISDSDGKDAWGNFFLYAVSGDLTQVKNFSQHSGAIEVLSENGTSRLASPSSAHYVILSTGANMFGSYNSSSKSYVSCTKNNRVLETINCDGDHIFVDSVSYTEKSKYGYYDDMITYTSYDPNIHSSGGVYFMFENGCPSTFNEVSLDDPNRISGLLNVVNLESPVNNSDKTLCFSPIYNNFMQVYNNENSTSDCPESWTAVGVTSGYYGQSDFYVLCVI